jgi:hypothetical protein
MNRQTASILASVMGTVGILFVLAMVFHILPQNYGLFLGIASFLISSSLYAIRGRLRNE